MNNWINGKCHKAKLEGLFTSGKTICGLWIYDREFIIRVTHDSKRVDCKRCAVLQGKR